MMVVAKEALPDCVIAGSGPTGLTLALELARRGKSVRLFDGASGASPETESRALGILPATLTVLKPSGVTDRLLAEGQKLTSVKISQRGVPKFTVDIAKGGGQYPFILSLPQGRTERILAEALKDHSVEPEWNTQVIDIDQSAEHPAFLIERNGKQEKVAGKLAAGCDGARSTVREKLGIPFGGDKDPTTFSLADVRLKEPHPKGELLLNRVKEGVIGQIPLPNGDVRLVGSLPDVEKHPAIAPHIQSIGWMSDFSIAFRHAKNLQKGPFFLAGDAAHVHSPVGGRGMNTGIGDAAWLAWLISQGRQSEYEAYRLPVVKSVLSQTRMMTNTLFKPNRVADFLVSNLLPHASKLSFVQKRIASQLLAQNTPHPEWID